MTRDLLFEELLHHLGADGGAQGPELRGELLQREGPVVVAVEEVEDLHQLRVVLRQLRPLPAHTRVIRQHRETETETRRQHRARETHANRRERRREGREWKRVRIGRSRVG